MIMKKIETNELFENVRGFLKTKGISLAEGSYTRRVQQGCGILSDLINMTQSAVQETKAKVDVGLDQMRQTIHEKTAPKPSVPVTDAPAANPPAPVAPAPAAAANPPIPARVAPSASLRKRARKTPQSKKRAKK